MRAPKLLLNASISVLIFSGMSISFSGPAKAERSVDGSYLNTNGNKLELDGNNLFFTGIWNDEKVTRKQFPFIVKDNKTFQLGAQVCTMKKDSFSCLRQRDGRVLDYALVAPKQVASKVNNTKQSNDLNVTAKDAAIAKAEAEAVKAKAEADIARKEAELAKSRVAELAVKADEEARKSQGVTAENNKLRNDLASAKTIADAQSQKAQIAEAEAAKARADANNIKTSSVSVTAAVGITEQAIIAPPQVQPVVAQNSVPQPVVTSGRAQPAGIAASSNQAVVAQNSSPPPVVANQPRPTASSIPDQITTSNANSANQKIADLRGQILVLEVVIKEQTESLKSAPAAERSAIDATIAAVKKRVEILKLEYSRLDTNFNTYLTSIKPNDRDLYLTSRRASEIYPRIPYYIPGTSETGEFWVEPTVSDRGVMGFSFQFRDVASSVEKVRGKIDMSLEDIEKTQKALFKLHEWSIVAHEQKLRRNFEKRVICFPERDCPADGERLDGAASTEVRFNVYEDGSTAGRIQRNKGRFIEGYNVSIDSALLLQAYLNHVINEAKLEFKSGTQDKKALDSMFK
jgi:hypothetical protein